MCLLIVGRHLWDIAKLEVRSKRNGCCIEQSCLSLASYYGCCQNLEAILMAHSLNEVLAHGIELIGQIAKGLYLLSAYGNNSIALSKSYLMSRTACNHAIYNAIHPSASKGRLRLNHAQKVELARKVYGNGFTIAQHSYFLSLREVAIYINI